MTRPRRADPEVRRRQVLDAAVRVFARKGFAATRIEDVAAEAGIGKGSVYLYFDSREALLDGAFAELVAESEATLERAADGVRPPLARLEELVRGVLTSATSRPELSRILLDLWSMGRGDPEPGDIGLPLDMAQVYRQYRKVVADLLREAAVRGAVRPGLGEDSPVNNI